MTPEEISEYIKCYKDPLYYLNNYGYVFDLEKKMRDRLTLFPFQVDIIRQFHSDDYKNSIVLKSRQQGLSVITAGYVAWKLLFGTDERILIIANDYKGATRFVDSVNIFLDYAPKWMLPDSRVTDNKNEIVFSNGCSLKAVASGANAGRGEALTLLILDETAFIDYADEIWAGAGLALSVVGGKCIMISTPYGTGNLYHRTWVAAKRGDNDFRPIIAHWSGHPVLARGLEWREDEFGVKKAWSPWYEAEKKRLEYDSVKIAQELDLSFEGSRNVVIESNIIERFRQKLKDRKLACYFDYLKLGSPFVEYTTNFRVWHVPLPNVNYIVAADVSRGDGSDFSTIQVIDAINLKQVAEYRGKVAPDEFARVIKAIATSYNMAYVAVECNSFGLVTSLGLKNELQYPIDKIFHSKNAQQLYNKEWNVNHKKDADIPGWQTTTKSRPIIISTINKYMREGEIEINSDLLLDEFTTFIFATASKNSNEVKAQHAPGYHDDLIFAFGIALVMRDTEYQNVYWNIETLDAMLKGFQVTQSNFNMQSINISTSSQSGKNEDDDLNWLLSPIMG